MLTKKILRSKILFTLRKQTAKKRQKKSLLIKKKLFRLKIFREAKRIMFYMAYDGEVETEEMIKESLNKGKIVSVPVCDQKRRRIIPCKIERNTIFKIGPYGIKEPLRKIPLPIKALDLVIVPGLAFDKKGNRLGRGKGYYDRFLKKISSKTVSVGLAFDFQIFNHLPVSTSDVSVDRVLFA
ncbi:MAG: 5-formyltetrahydrofolate cyclo-ligase [Candidatus Omnitrophica bacterium]|nr:5-formyltetrahydrofolate cyclo-ligase [Candidatus Omnitrophota bacterium]MCM8800234.1 5-formyltetrahydrofolate cyclo-ligase [Candidatus Omnitrophota bacterium]